MTSFLGFPFGFGSGQGTNVVFNSDTSGVTLGNVPQYTDSSGQLLEDSGATMGQKLNIDGSLAMTGDLNMAANAIDFTDGAVQLKGTGASTGGPIEIGALTGADNNCMAIGHNAVANTGDDAIAIGPGASATGEYAISIGSGTTNSIDLTCKIGRVDMEDIYTNSDVCDLGGNRPFKRCRLNEGLELKDISNSTNANTGTHVLYFDDEYNSLATRDDAGLVNPYFPDGTYLPLAGGTMVGEIKMGSNAVTGTGANTAGSYAASLTTASTDSTTGAITSAGGLGVAGAINSGGAIATADTTASTSTITGALKSAGGLGVAGRANIGDIESVGSNSVAITYPGNMNVLGTCASASLPGVSFYTDGNAYPCLFLYGATRNGSSISFDTGYSGATAKSASATSNFRILKGTDLAFQYAAGVGVNSNVSFTNAGTIAAASGTLAWAKPITTSDTTASSSTVTGSGVFGGGVGVAGAAFVGGAVVSTLATDATSATTGAIRASAGGISCAGSMWAAYHVNADRNMYIGPNLRPVMSGGYTAINNVNIFNTTTETSIIGSGLGSLNTPAGTISAGQTGKLTASGIIEITANPTITFRVYGGASGTTLLATFAVALSTLVAGSAWRLESYSVVKTIGAATVASVQINSTFQINDGTNVNTYANQTLNATDFDTTVANLLKVTAQWSAADPSNDFTCNQFITNSVYVP